MLNARYRRWGAEVVGYDRLMFATDYPYLRVRRAAVSAFFHAGDLAETDRTKIASGNWERLRAEIRR
jgi:uncharacterized protein